MNEGRRLFLGLLGWTTAVTAAHGALNVDWDAFLNSRRPWDKRKLNVAYIPVT